jgi:plasmid maintenance system killer protein
MKGWHATCPLSTQTAKAVPRRRDRLEQLGRFPGWKLHPLKGDLKGFWSLTVSGNSRLIFGYDN